MREEDKAYAFAFGVPVNAKGLTLVPAEHEICEYTSLFDHPISGSIFINDATLIFDNVFIPTETIGCPNRASKGSQALRYILIKTF